MDHACESAFRAALCAADCATLPAALCAGSYTILCIAICATRCANLPTAFSRAI